MSNHRIMLGVVVASVWALGLMVSVADPLTPKVYTGASGGTWELATNWTPNGVPTNSHAVYITNLTVKVAAEAVAGSLEVVGGALIVAGATTTVLTQTPYDTARTNAVGLAVAGDFRLAGDCSIGGVNQLCESYLTVGGDLTLAGGKALAVYAGPRTNAVFTLGGAQVVVTGTTTVNTGSWIYPDCDTYTGAPVVFDLQDLVIAANAGFDATQRGWGYRNFGAGPTPAGTLYEMVSGNYYCTLSPGAGTSYTRGGGYGGNGGNAGAGRGLAYGFKQAPFQPGAPNGIYNGVLANNRRGGGAIRIAASNVVFNGALHADGGFQGAYGGSSGGGIWVTCAHIDLGVSARMSAVGGDIQGYTSGGGGGRLSIGVGLSAGSITGLYAGTEPAGLLYAPLTQLPVNIRGGQASGNYAPSGTATLVLGPDADRFLQVKGSPLQAGTPVAGYGTHRSALNQLVTNTVPSPGLDPASEGGVRYTCAGYTLAVTNGVFFTGTTNWVSMTMSNNLVLTWLWHNCEFRFRTAAGANGRIRIGDETNTVFEQWMPEGATTDFTAEAIPDAGYRFLCWEGDIVMGETCNPALTMPTRLQARSVTARFVPLSPVLANKVFTGANNGAWEVAGNWTPSGVPTTDDALFITNKTVYVDSEAVAGSLVLSGGALIVAGSTATVTAQKPRDAARTAPVGLFVQSNLWLSGNCSVGGVQQSCVSYLTVGGDLTLTGTKALAVYAGPRQGLHPFKNGGARVTVAGTTAIDAGCWFYPDCDTFTGHPVVFDLQDLTVAETGGFDATQRGWGYTNVGPRIPADPDYYERIIPNYWDTPAPGWGFDYSIGAGHGGRGGTYSTVRGRGLAYGNANAPSYPGSPNGIYNSLSFTRRGGGTARIQARGVLLDGRIKADAGTQSGFGGSSGGGIWLTCKTIAYGIAASMSAQGGLCSSGYSSPGGGGRISIGLNLSAAEVDALFAGETPEGLLYEALTQLPADVTGGQGRLTGGVYAYAESGTATFVASAEADKTLVVAGLPLQAGDPSPAYGPNSFAHGQWVTNSVAVYGADAGVDDRVRYRCQGYTLANLEGPVSSGTTNWVAVQLSENLTLTWLWAEPEVRVDASAGMNGIVRRGAVEGAFSEWLAVGATSASVEAVPDAGYEFLYWLGDVPLALATNNPLQFTADSPHSVQALFRLAEAPATRVWNGGTAALGAWHDVANWLPAGNIPGKEDHVVIAAGYCCTTNYAECGSLAISNAAILRVASRTTPANRAQRTESNSQLAIEKVYFDEGRLVVRRDLDLRQSAQLGAGGSNQTYAVALDVGGDMSLRDTASLAVYGGPTNRLFDFETGTATVRVGGLFRVETNCWVYPTSDRYTGGSPRFDVGQLSLAAGGGFNATERGFDRVKGRVPETVAPGLGYSFDRGAGYGGRGGNGQRGYFGQPYGFAKAPIHPGSCNGDHLGWFARGGGLVRVHVGGSVTLNGSVIADGSQTTVYGGPSGGGIWITAERFKVGSSAVLRARGGLSNYNYSGGGGGRIALGVKLTAADLAQLGATGEPVSKVETVDAAAFGIRYPGVALNVSPVTTNATETSAQAGTFILLDATRQGTVLLLR